ncbi:MAG TPA: hypothetical protein VHW45_20160 [Candidatus Sulfotelmatobacter sp.]|nr:hypothetical protein [Candidatus Sulfotelmatobacter sp.]
MRQSPFLSGSTILNAIPAQAELVWLRRRESELRKAIAEQGFTSTTAKALSGAIAEIINNVWQHAQTTLPALLAYRSEQERFSVVIADLGVGVLNSLRTNPAYASLNSSMTALKKAMAVGVSRLPDSDGYGFDTVLRALADQWGGVRLRTGEAILEFHGTAEVRKAHASYGVALPGLQVAFACCANPPATPIAL